MKKGSLSISSIGLFASLCLTSVLAGAWGLGNISVDSSVNEPLDAFIPLTGIRPDELSSLKLELLTQLKPAEGDKKHPQLQILADTSADINPLKISVQVSLRDGTPIIHLTSQNPVYAECDRSSFNCYNFYQFGINADWRSRSLTNHVTRRFSIIPKLDEALGAIKLNSVLGERLDLEIDLLDRADDLGNLNVRLAPIEAWIKGIHSGESEFKYAQSLGISFVIEKNKLRLQSQGPFKRSFSDSYQDSSQPMVILLEATWKDGRELKKYTIYLPT